MLSRSILKWLVLLLTLATVTRSEHYYIVPANSTDLYHEYRNGICFTLEQLVKTDLLSGGDNLTLSFLPGYHVLTEQLLISNFSHVQITGQNTSTTVVGFHSNCTILFFSITMLNIERLGFIGANVGSQNSHQGLIIDGTNDVYIKDCYFLDCVLFNQAEIHIVKIASTLTVMIESTLFVNNTGQTLHIEADEVYITNSVFTRNDGGVYIESNNVLIDNTKFNYNSAESGGAVDLISDTVMITWCNFTNNKASLHGGAIHVDSGSVSISNSGLTNNRADGKGGAIDVNSGNVSISNSELTNNRADYGGAIRVDSGNVSIFNSELTNNRADHWGGAIFVDSGRVSISNSELTNNRAEYGGAIDVESGNVSIYNSELTNNRADKRGVIYVRSGSSVSISNSELTNNSADSGGAIGVNSGNVYISSSELINNSADWGGAIYVISGSVSISNCELTNNSADSAGGAIGVISGNVSISNSELTNNSADWSGAIYVISGSVSISNCELTNNSADHGGIYIAQSLLILKNTNITNNTASFMVDGSSIYAAANSRVEFNGPTTLSNNRGMLGGAISIVQSEIYINTEGVIITNNTATSGGGIFLRESTLFVNEPIKIYQNTAHQDGGGIYAYSSTIIFNTPNKQSEITNNNAENGGGINVVATTLNLTRSYVNIDSNTANANGGGVYLQQSSKLYLFKNDEEYRTQDQHVKLMINNNSAQYGGGIFVADGTESGACRVGATDTDAPHIIFADCFIQTIKLYEWSKNNSNYFNTFITNNTAQSGANIYGGLLDRCTISKNAEYPPILSNGSGLDYIHNTVKSSTASISSRPIQVIFCNNEYNYISVRKGRKFTVSVMAVDQVGNPMNATIRSSVVSESGVGRLKEGQAEQEVGNQCTELEYNVFSQDSSAQVELYANGPCINLGISKQLINISFQICSCPIGLKPVQSDIECKCDCGLDLQRRYQITNCFEENGAITLERNSNTWIAVINTTNETGYVVSSCTLDYCVQKPVNISLSNPDEQCAYNRSGVLCGECKPGLSFVLATSNCKKCSDLYLLLLIPFALAGILLVALILVLNITIATGNIHGLIFYANIVAANRAIFFPSLNNFLTIFVSWLNLDLGIEVCFYDIMNSQEKVLLQLVFPAYLFLLMFLLIILSQYFDSFAKLLSNRNPVAALGTLVLLSYSKLLQFIIAALQYRVLDYPDDTSDIVWVYDGNVQYFTHDHIPRFVAAAIILIAGGLFTVLLFFGQWFPRCSKVMIWTKNTKYIGFMDAYHAPFTPKHRYWVGLLLFALIAHNLVASMAPDTFLPVLSSGAVSVGLIGWKLLNNRLYKSKFCDSLESLYLLNIVCLAFGTLYVKDTNKDLSALANTSIAISFILFVTTLCYHFYNFVLKKSNTWLKIEETIRNLRADAADMRLRRANNAQEIYQLVADENDDDELLEAVDNYEQRDPLDPLYTDGAEEEADPDRYITPPIIRPATRPEQLRLSYMDELAPLTTEDYRQALPPQKVNHRPAVTHTEIGPIRNEV
ncbi:uncharacterized protein LOC135337962 [Halichondria panicea]|uniref:uncharacterized protein LOC135337962 n=1 Tax=Halichondria panicea TaxID=6063 RepID=UPI00312B9104